MYLEDKKGVANMRKYQLIKDRLIVFKYDIRNGFYQNEDLVQMVEDILLTMNEIELINEIKEKYPNLDMLHFMETLDEIF